jgi:hypothetical protein
MFYTYVGRIYIILLRDSNQLERTWPLGKPTELKTFLKFAFVNDNVTEYFVNDNITKYFLDDNKTKYFLNDNVTKCFVNDNVTKYREWINIRNNTFPIPEWSGFVCLLCRQVYTGNNYKEKQEFVSLKKKN